MELDVEIGVLDPVRLIQAKGHLHQAAAKQRGIRCNRDSISSRQPLNGQRLAARGRLEDSTRCPRARTGRGRVERQECGVQTGQLLHDTSATNSN